MSRVFGIGSSRTGDPQYSWKSDVQLDSRMKIKVDGKSASLLPRDQKKTYVYEKYPVGISQPRLILSTQRSTFRMTRKNLMGQDNGTKKWYFLSRTIPPRANFAAGLECDVGRQNEESWWVQWLALFCFLSFFGFSVFPNTQGQPRIPIYTSLT